MKIIDFFYGLNPTRMFFLSACLISIIFAWHQIFFIDLNQTNSRLEKSIQATKSDIVKIKGLQIIPKYRLLMKDQIVTKTTHDFIHDIMKSEGRIILVDYRLMEETPLNLEILALNDNKIKKLTKSLTLSSINLDVIGTYTDIQQLIKTMIETNKIQKWDEFFFNMSDMYYPKAYVHLEFEVLNQKITEHKIKEKTSHKKPRLSRFFPTKKSKRPPKSK